MAESLYFRIVSHLIRDGATYSIPQHAWTISVPELFLAYGRRLSDLPQKLPAFFAALDEGVNQGLWTMEHDAQRGVETVVLHSLSALPGFGLPSHARRATA
jgi:hypothetical protein